MEELLAIIEQQAAVNQQLILIQIQNLKKSILYGQ